MLAAALAVTTFVLRSCSSSIAKGLCEYSRLAPSSVPVLSVPLGLAELLAEPAVALTHPEEQQHSANDGEDEQHSQGNGGFSEALVYAPAVPPAGLYKHR
jgi:hypothetical protein